MDGIGQLIVVHGIELCQDDVEIDVVGVQFADDLIGLSRAANVVELFETEFAQVFAQNGHEFDVEWRDMALTFDHAFEVCFDSHEIFLRLEHRNDALEDFDLGRSNVENFVEDIDSFSRIIQFFFEDPSLLE